MRHKSLTTSDNHIIEVYDNVFSIQENQYHYDFVYDLDYRFQYFRHPWSNDQQYYLKSNLSKAQIQQLEILENNNIIELLRKHVGSNVHLNQCWILATTSSHAAHIFHNDEPYDAANKNKSRKIFLYHINPFWNKNWHGETLFASDQEEPEIAVQYVGGRVIIYDSSVFHCSAPIIPGGHIRFILAANFQDNEI